MPAPVHARTQIRRAVKTTLTGLTATGGQVYIGRTRNLPAGHPDTLLVYARETRSAPDAQGTVRKLAHTLRVFIEGRTSLGAADEDDDAAERTEERLDQIEIEVATAIGADATLGGLVKDILLVASTLNAQVSGERHSGEVRMEFSVEYRTAENAPGVIIA